MKRILTIIIVASFFSCSDDYQINKLKGALDFESEYKQQFNVSTSDSIIEVQGEKGTKISFNINDLEGVLDGSNTDKDSISIRLIELTSKEDLLRANAQTVSNGKWLISGGAFHIEINGYGPLQLKKGKTINVQFPLNSTEDNMRIFYGERNSDQLMNWDSTNTYLQEQKYFGVYYKEEELILESVEFNDNLESAESIIKRDTLGYITISEFNNRYPNLDTLFIANDTLRGLKTYLDWSVVREEVKTETTLRPARIELYQEIEIAQLGWINIDKYKEDEDNVTINLKFNKQTDAISTFLIDNTNTTVINILSDTFEIPADRSFTLISLGVKGDVFFVYNEAVTFKENSSHVIALKKVKGSNLKPHLSLNK